MPCHESVLDTDLETTKATGWCLCTEPLTALESVDGTSAAKMYSMKFQEVVQLLDQVNQIMAFMMICGVLAKTPKVVYVCRVEGVDAEEQRV